MKHKGKMRKTDILGSRFWLRALGLLLGIALVFTALSRVSASMTVAKVHVQQFSSRRIEHLVSAQGRVEIRREAAEVTQPDLLVKSINVREGEIVEAGEELFRIDGESLSEKIDSVEKEIETLELQNDAMKQNDALAARQQSVQKARAGEDYADAKAKSKKATEAARKELSDAKAAANDSSKALAKAEQSADSQQELVRQKEDALASCTDTQTAAEEAVKKAEEAVDEQKKLLETLENTSGEEESPADSTSMETAKEQLQRLQQELTARQEELSQAQAATEAAQGELSKATEELEARQTALTAAQEAVQQGKTDVQQKKSSLEEVKAAGEDAKKAAARAVEDASMGQGADASQAINDLSMEEWQKQLEKLKKLQKEEGIIKASQEGVVTKLYVDAGQRTTDTAAVMLGDVSSGLLFTAQIGKEDAEYVAVGDTVSLKGVGKSLENCPVISVETDETGQMLQVTVETEPGVFSPGETATMEASRSSEEFGRVIPMTAILQEEQKTYVMIADTEETVLGSQNVARKIEVEVLDKNASYAAVDGAALDSEMWVITEQDRYVEAGDRVRLIQE